MKYLFFALLLVISAQVSTFDLPRIDCAGVNEEYQQCGNVCERNCYHVRDIEPFEECQCSSGCFCKEGYVRLDDSMGSPCVEEEECTGEYPLYWNDIVRD